MARERRVYERYPCAVLGSCIGSANKPIGVKCHDIGAFGARVVSTEELSKGTHLRINFCTNSDKPLLLKGVVRWTNKTPDEWQAGVVFNKPTVFPLGAVL